MWGGWSGSGVTDQVGQDPGQVCGVRSVGAPPSLAPRSENTSCRMWGLEQASQQPQEDLSVLPAWAASSLALPSLLGLLSYPDWHPTSTWCQSDPIILHLGLKLWVLKPGVHLPDLQFKASSYTAHAPPFRSLFNHPYPSFHSHRTTGQSENPISLSA